jgi:hypothetical protein
MEQRWREGLDGTGWRLRPYLKYSMPLQGKVNLNLSTEPFINLNTTSFQTKKGLDRVRNLVTVSIPVSKKVTGEVGYMNQHLFLSGRPDESDHVAYFGLSMNL